MATLVVQAQPREKMGKAVKKLRRVGLLPAVVYGPAVQGVQPISLNMRDFMKVFGQAGPSTLLSLRVQGSAIRPVLIHQATYDHFHRTLIHIDFFAPDMMVELTVNVPLAFTGEAPAISMQDGIALHMMSEVQVRALPDNIPAAIEVDMNSLAEIGSQLTAGDLPLPTGVALVTPAEELIVRINPPTVVEEPEVAEEVEAAEAEAAEAEAEPEEPTAEATEASTNPDEEPQS
jgi:large subunit ribosomal protein L25